MNYKGEIMRPGGERKPLMVINQVTMSATVEAVDVASIDDFTEALEANVIIFHMLGQLSQGLLL